MTPHERILNDPTLSLEEKLEEARWFKHATPEEIERGDSVAALWYQQQEEAEELQEYIRSLFDRQFE